MHCTHCTHNISAHAALPIMRAPTFAMDITHTSELCVCFQARKVSRCDQGAIQPHLTRACPTSFVLVDLARHGAGTGNVDVTRRTLGQERELERCRSAWSKEEGRHSLLRSFPPFPQVWVRYAQLCLDSGRAVLARRVLAGLLGLPSPLTPPPSLPHVVACRAAAHSHLPPRCCSKRWSAYTAPLCSYLLL